MLIRNVFAFLSKIFWSDCDRYFNDRQGHTLHMGDRVYVIEHKCYGIVVAFDVPDSRPICLAFDVNTFWVSNKEVLYDSTLTIEELLTHHLQVVINVLMFNYG